MQPYEAFSYCFYMNVLLKDSVIYYLDHVSSHAVFYQYSLLIDPCSFVHYDNKKCKHLFSAHSSCDLVIICTPNNQTKPIYFFPHVNCQSKDSTEGCNALQVILPYMYKSKARVDKIVNFQKKLSLITIRNVLITTQVHEFQ